MLGNIRFNFDVTIFDKNLSIENKNTHKNLSQRHGQRNKNETCDQTTDPSDLVLLYQRCTRVANSNRTTTVTRIGQWTTHILKRKCASPCPTVNSTSHRMWSCTQHFLVHTFSAQEYTVLSNLHCHSNHTHFHLITNQDTIVKVTTT